jgi:hypothetical protein
VPEKTIRQQPVTLTEIVHVNYIVHPQGGIDTSYIYRPVDETGTPIGEQRALSGSKAGAAAQEIKNWITTKVLPEINAHEGTA